jgi:hypothetical protein
MSRVAQLRSQLLYPALVVIVGWAGMVSYEVQAYLRRVPELGAPRTGVSMMDWIELDGMRLRVAQVQFGQRRHLKLELVPDRGATDRVGLPSAFVSRTSRWFHAMRGRTVPWNGDDVPVAGWAVQVEEWPDVDVWIVGPLVFYD